MAFYGRHLIGRIPRSQVQRLPPIGPNSQAAQPIKLREERPPPR